MKRTALLQRRKATADGELTKLYAMRQTLVEENLAGTYSDEIFKEQNALIEDKIKDLHSATDNALIN